MNKYMQQNILPNLREVYFSYEDTGNNPVRTKLYGGGYIYLSKDDIHRDDIVMTLSVSRTRKPNSESFYNIHLVVKDDRRPKAKVQESVTLDVETNIQYTFFSKLTGLNISYKPLMGNKVIVKGNGEQLQEAQAILESLQGNGPVARDKINTNFKFKNTKII